MKKQIPAKILKWALVCLIAVTLTNFSYSLATGEELSQIQHADLSAGKPIGAAFTISNPSDDAYSPDVAYNSQWDEYFVLWETSACDDIIGQRVSKWGELFGQNQILTAGCPDRRESPHVVYNSKHNEYLVVWLETTQNIDHVMAQRRSPDLSPRGGTITLMTSSGTNNDFRDIAVSYAYTSDKYLVVWGYHVYIPSINDYHNSILGRVVESDGTTPANEFVIAQDPGGQPRITPDLAYNRHANNYLVVWTQEDAIQEDAIYGRLVDGGGGLLTPPSLIADDSAMDYRFPSVAAIPTAPGPYKFLVVHLARNSTIDEFEIRGRLVEEDGTPAPDYLPIFFDIPWINDPSVAGNENSSNYLVVGSAEVPTTFGRIISSEGLLVGEWRNFSPNGNLITDQGVASGSGDSFLAVWNNLWSPTGASHISGQLWGHPVYLPTVVR